MYDPSDATSLLTIGGLANGTLYGNKYVEFLQTGGGEFYLKMPGILPLQLLSFKGAPCAMGNCLSWHTADEIGTASFLLEKSADGRVFTPVASVKAIGAGSNAYSFIDDKYIDGTGYYRLKMIDIDGKFTYSKIIKLNHGVQSITIAPNPVLQSFVLQGVPGRVQVTIVDANGRQLKQLTASQNQQIDVTFLQSGIYFLKLSNGQAVRLLKK